MRLQKVLISTSILALATTLAACGGHTNAALTGQNDASRAAIAASVGLHTQGNLILDRNNQVWMARGVNIFDTRGCNACAYGTPNVNEVIRRADTAITQWHANVLRLNLESYASADGRAQWGGVLRDANYLADVKTIVDHISQYQGVTILLSLLIDPTFDDHEIPTQQTAAEWTQLTKTFASYPNIIFGVGNEPHSNSGDDAQTIADQNDKCWQGMTESVDAIRTAEDAAGVTHHLVAVQGTLWWARFTAYYETHPIQSDNIIYETHIYDNTGTFPEELTNPHQTLPMIIGEFGAWPGEMEMADCTNLMNLADQLQVPYIGWSFSASCGAAPLLQATTTDACGIDAALTPTAWGTLLQTHLLATQPNAPVYTGPVPTPTPTPVVTPGSPATDNNTVIDGNTVVILPMPTPTVTHAPTNAPAPTPPVTVPPVSAGAGSISLGSAGVCVDALGGAIDHAGVIVSTCDASHLTQSWTYTGGTLRTQGKCVAVINNAAYSGAFLELQPCDGQAGEQFTVSGKTIGIAGTSLCFDTLGEMTYNLMPVVLTPCNGGATQAWNMP